MKLFKKILKSKALYLGTALVIQLLILVLLMTYFSHEFLPIYYFMLILSIVVSFFVMNRDSDSSSKLLWVFIIMALPIFGGMMINTHRSFEDESESRFMTKNETTILRINIK